MKQIKENKIERENKLIRIKGNGNNSITNIKDNNLSLNVASTHNQLKRKDKFKVINKANLKYNKSNLNVASTHSRLFEGVNNFDSNRDDDNSRLKNNNSSLNVASTCYKVRRINNGSLFIKVDNNFNFKLKKGAYPQFRIISLMLIFLFSSLCLLSIISTASAVDYRFQNSSGANLTIIYGSNGNLSVLGNISAANFNVTAFLSTYNASYNTKFSGTSSEAWKSGASVIYNNTNNVKVGIGTSAPLTLLHVVNNNVSFNASYFYQNVSLNAAYAGKFESFTDSAGSASLVYLGYFDGTKNYSIYSQIGNNYFENLSYFNETVRIMPGYKLGIGVNSSDELAAELTIKVNTTKEAASPADSKFIYFGTVNSSALGHSINLGLSFNMDPRKGYYHFSGNYSNLYINVPNNTNTGKMFFAINGTTKATLNYTTFKVNLTLSGGSYNSRSGRVFWCNGDVAGRDTGDACCAFYQMKCKDIWFDYNDYSPGPYEVYTGYGCTTSVEYPGINDYYMALCY